MVLSIALLVDKKGKKTFQDFPAFGAASNFVRDARKNPKYVAGCAISTSGARYCFGQYKSEAAQESPAVAAEKPAIVPAASAPEDLDIGDLLNEIEDA